MEFWERLRREIGNNVTVIALRRNGKELIHTGTLKSVEDCYGIGVDYMGFDTMDFNFVRLDADILKIIDKDNQVLYENPEVHNYRAKFNSFDDVIDERYRLFGDYFLKCAVDLVKDYVYNTIQYSDKFRSDFKRTITDPQNNMSYWFPKIEGLGFKTPKTETFSLPCSVTEPLEKYLENKHDLVSYELYKTNLLKLLANSAQFNINDKVFIKSGVFSNKFNFDNCKIDNWNELADKFSIIYNVELKQARGKAPTEIVLREFIDSSSNRKTIYNGMPLNTEFRVFYDFDNKKTLGIDNYWHSQEMRHGLKNNQDINNYLDEEDSINAEFKKLKPALLEQTSKLENCNLRGIWSVDFMWNGDEFVLIDMALAECSHAWERYQHLSPNGVDPNSITINESIMPNRIKELISLSPSFASSETTQIN